MVTASAAGFYGSGLRCTGGIGAVVAAGAWAIFAGVVVALLVVVMLVVPRCCPAYGVWDANSPAQWLLFLGFIAPRAMTVLHAGRSPYCEYCFFWHMG